MDQPDRIVVVSDVHMGPEEKHPLFRSQVALAELIDELTSSGDRVELVLLGDILDYLPFGDRSLRFLLKDALEKTEAILNTQNALVFAALGRFVAKSPNVIRWCWGNHDLELAFPEVRAALEKRIFDGADNDSRLVWHLDNKPIDRALPGGVKLRLVHGNADDAWNRVNPSYTHGVAQQGGAESFFYPHGSRLVAQVLNVLKSRGYGHVDLLKPEESVALPLTMGLWPDEARPLVEAAFRLGVSATLEGFMRKLFPSRTAGLESLAESPASAEDAGVELLSQALDVNAYKATLAQDGPEGQLEAFPSVGDVVNALKGQVTDWLHGRAAKANTESQAFLVDAQGPLDAATLSSNYQSPFGGDAHGPLEHILVAGHTHLAKSLPYGRIHYFNTGTWAQLMRLPRTFEANDMGAMAGKLQAALADPATAPRVLRPFRKLTYVEVDLRDNGVTPFRARLIEHAPPPELDAIP